MTDDNQIMRLIEEAAAEEAAPAGGKIEERSFARLLAADRSDLPAVSFFTARDGLQMAYRRYPAPASERVLILVHGSAGHAAHLHPLARAIVGRGLAEVYAPDMRGHGLSGRRRGNAVRYTEQMRDDLIDLMALVRRAAPQRRIYVAGHSAGGGLLLRLAGDAAGQEISGYVLLAPFLGARAPTSRPGLGGWLTLYGKRIGALSKLNRLGIRWLNQLPVIEFNQPLTACDGTETLCWSYETMLAFAPGDWRAELSAIDAGRPLLVVVGTGDECFVPEAYAPALAATAAHGRVKVIAGLGHWELPAASEVHDLIGAWLAAH